MENNSIIEILSNNLNQNNVKIRNTNHSSDPKKQNLIEGNYPVSIDGKQFQYRFRIKNEEKNDIYDPQILTAQVLLPVICRNNISSHEGRERKDRIRRKMLDGIPLPSDLPYKKELYCTFNAPTTSVVSETTPYITNKNDFTGFCWLELKGVYYSELNKEKINDFTKSFHNMMQNSHQLTKNEIEGKDLCNKPLFFQI